LINSGFNNCPMEISVDNHTLLVIATDGSNLQPMIGKNLQIKYNFNLNRNIAFSRSRFIGFLRWGAL
jgi:hypothetical protein